MKKYKTLWLALIVVLAISLVWTGAALAAEPWLRARFMQVLVDLRIGRNLIVENDATIYGDNNVAGDNNVTTDNNVSGDNNVTGAVVVGERLELTAGTQVTVTDNCTLTLTSPYQVIVSASDVGFTNVVPSGVGMFAIQNEGSFTATITESGSIFTSGGNVVLPPEGVVVAYYDGTDAWAWIDKDN